MTEKPKSLEERLAEDIENILGACLRVDRKTKYGICNVSKQPDCYSLRVVDEYSRPLALFKIDFSGQIIAELDDEHVKAWKDDGQKIPLTPDDLIDAFNEVRN